MVIKLSEARKMCANFTMRADLDNWFSVAVGDAFMWRIGANEVQVKGILPFAQTRPLLRGLF